MSRLDDLRQPDRGEVAVALVADHNRIRIGHLVTDRHRRCPAVRRLGVADVQIVVQKYAASHRRDGDGAVLDLQFLDRFSDEIMGDAVSAAGAVVGRMPLQPGTVGMPLEIPIEYTHDVTSVSIVSKTRSMISCCWGSTPPKWRTWEIGGTSMISAWLSASRSSSSNCPLLASTITI